MTDSPHTTNQNDCSTKQNKPRECFINKFDFETLMEIDAFAHYHVEAYRLIQGADNEDTVRLIEHSAFQKAIAALKFYADGMFDEGKRARDTLKDLGEL